MKHQFGHRSEKGKYIDSTFEPQTVITGEPEIRNSHIKGNSVISDRAIIDNCIIVNSIISDDAVLCNCIVIDSTITGKANISNGYSVITVNSVIVDEGDWSRSPISFTLPTGWTVTESKDDKVTVSCTKNTIKKWLSGAGRRYGKLVGMSEAEIDVVEFYVKQIADIKQVMDNKTEILWKKD